MYALLHFVAYAWLDKGLVLTTSSKTCLQAQLHFCGHGGLAVRDPFADLVQWCHSGHGAGWQQRSYCWSTLVALLGMLHFYWKKAAKNDFSVVMVYALILAVLLGWRVMRKGGFKALWQVR